MTNVPLAVILLSLTVPTAGPSTSMPTAWWTSEETLISLKEVFSRCEEMLSIKIKKVVLIIPSYYAEFIVSEGSSTITNEDGIITNNDVLKTLQTCVYDKVPSNKEFVSVTPIEFSIGDKKTKEPIGMKADKFL